MCPDFGEVQYPISYRRGPSKHHREAHAIIREQRDDVWESVVELVKTYLSGLSLEVLCGFVFAVAPDAWKRGGLRSLGSSALTIF